MKRWLVRTGIILAAGVVLAAGLFMIGGQGTVDASHEPSFVDIKSDPEADPDPDENGIIKSRYISLSDYAFFHHNHPGWINWPRRDDGDGESCSDAQTPYKTMPWLPQTPQSFMDEVHNSDTNWYTANVSAPDASNEDTMINGNYFHLSGNCEKPSDSTEHSSPVDGGTSTFSSGDRGAWLNHQAFGGWTAVNYDDDSGGSWVTPVRTDEDSQGGEKEVDTDEFTNTPRMWGWDQKDDADHKDNLWNLNGWATPDHDWELHSSGVTAFRHTFDIDDDTYDYIEDNNDVDYEIFAKADDWVQVFLNGNHVFTTREAVADASYDESLFDHLNRGKNVLAVQAIDKAGWAAGSSAGSPHNAGVHYELEITGEPPAEIRGDKHAKEDADQAVVDNQEVTLETEGESTTDNPFDFGLIPAGDHTVSTEAPDDYEVYYTVCMNTETCHDEDERSQYDGSVSVDVDPGDFAHIRFYYYLEEDEPEGNYYPKIYGANYINIQETFVRDNRRFDIETSAYVWPDAGIREMPYGSGDSATRMWLAGVWGEDSPHNDGDNIPAEGSRRTNPNLMSIFNRRAESSCPGPGSDLLGDCLQRVPMAYVPEDDGSGEPNTSTKDGSRTPRGNNWYDIREEDFGSHQRDKVVTACGSYTLRYRPVCGGIASYKTNEDLAERVGNVEIAGNFIRNVEISNIRNRAVVDSNGPRFQMKSIQGPVHGSVLQEYEERWNLPSGSHGPDPSQYTGEWDNLRNPDIYPGLFNSQVTSSVLRFRNYTRHNGLPNFTDTPLDIGWSEYRRRSRQYGDVEAVSLLQDKKGRNDQPYTDDSEPLTYTADINELERVDLMWDEYVDWTQIDDKGHWYTRKSRRATGVDRGERGDTHETEVNRIEETDDGSKEFVRSYWRCTNDDGDTHYHSSSNEDYDANDHHSDDDYTCTNYYTSYTSREEYCVDDTEVAYTTNSKGYYDDRTESRYGWYNTDTDTRAMPDGKDGETSQSAFYGSASNSPYNDSFSNTPLWGIVDNYWQDRNITNMDTSNTSINQDRSDHWIYDTSDPAYTGRHIFDQFHRPWFRDGWHKTGEECIWRYPNGDHREYEETVKVKDYYPDAKQVYEDTEDWEIDGHVYGKYGNEATFDGDSNGRVDIGWNWTENERRVRYEHSFDNHFRKLGGRARLGRTAHDRLYGMQEDKPIRAGRDMAHIYNPTIEVAEGDVFAGGNLHSFFQDSEANSAFLFSNNKINNFRAQGSGEYQEFEDYFFNPDQNRVDTFYPSGGGEAAVRYIFTNYDELWNSGEIVGSSISGTFNLDNGNDNEPNVYRRSGDLTLNGPTFTGGGGTIIVEGDLSITGNVDYPAGGTSERSDVPSVGLIVEGDISIDPGVRTVSGSYFSGGRVHTGSVLGDQDSPRDHLRGADDHDIPLTVNGLVIAKNYALARQLSGDDLAGGQETENFIYDGRVVINPPPGFSRVFTADAIWNDAIPRN